MKAPNLTGKLSGVIDEIKKRLSLKKRQAEGYALKGIQQHRMDIRLTVGVGEHLIKRHVKQAVLNDMWTIPTKGIAFAVGEPTGGLVEMEISYYAIAANADGLLNKLLAIENIKGAGVAQTQAT
ncbi:hypothetical protein [uncultured Imperialibacter sp.]|uniref:hypothetical protein n=1 Tax=uncultured Imperialibacter sp. TaxID=1672639 RepID=UPI0030D6FD99|tara:strand:- start:9534 stop:9905 length:372 start_codon:yes stop_codon:yes gene_type:complete